LASVENSLIVLLPKTRFGETKTSVTVAGYSELLVKRDFDYMVESMEVVHNPKV